VSVAPATSLPSAGTLLALAAGAIVVVSLLAPLMRRHPEAFPLLAVVTLPFRVPIAADGRTVNLLIPLYLVVAAGVVAHLLPRLLGWEDRLGAPEAQADEPSAPQARDARTSGSAERAVAWLPWLLLAVVALYVLQIAYSPDRAKAAENVAFFYLPFGLMFVLLGQVRWTQRLVVHCTVALVAIAVLLAGVGFVEYERKSLFLNPKLVAANQYDNFFRVNSVFFDPSIYGRFLVLVMIAVTTSVLWGGRRRAKLGAIVLLWLLAGLVTSFSQSSIAALLLGLAVLAAWRWSLRASAVAAGVLLALAVVVVLLAPEGSHFGLGGKGGSANNATTGRVGLIEGGLELFADRPLQGYGSGSFETEFKRHSAAAQATTQNATSASHTIPVTIAAEQGVIGLALYAVLICAALLALFDGAGRSPPRIAIAAAFAALVLHTWTYADFLEDPFTWALLAVGLALARRPPAAPAAPPTTV
jgi:O-antigen ligase